MTYIKFDYDFEMLYGSFSQGVRWISHGDKEGKDFVVTKVKLLLKGSICKWA